jgi:hypothetical protein
MREMVIEVQRGDVGGRPPALNNKPIANYFAYQSQKCGRHENYWNFKRFGTIH